MQNIDLSTKANITFSLPPILEAFCRYKFYVPKYGRYIKLNLKEDIGKLIFSHILYCDINKERPFMENPVTFILPVTDVHQYVLKYRFLHVPRWVEEKFILAIEYEFRTWVKERFRIGYEILKEDQKTITNSILRGLNVRDTKANFETIKKIDYRNRRRKEEETFKNLVMLEKSDI